MMYPGVTSLYIIICITIVLVVSAMFCARQVALFVAHSFVSAI